MTTTIANHRVTSISTYKQSNFIPSRIIKHPAAERHFMPHVRQSSRVAIPLQTGIRFIEINSIVYCSVESNYCKINLSNGEQILLSKTLKWIVAHLPEAGFVHAHASHLIAIDHVCMWSAEQLEMTGGAYIPISRSRRAEVQRKLGVGVS